MAVPLREYKITVDAYHRMGEAGIFKENDRVELVEGRIVEMNPIGSPHAWCVARLTAIFSGRPGTLVWPQNPVDLDEYSEPEPDVVIVRADASQDHTPTPEDTLLVIEVSDSSIRYDRQVKAPLYARTGVPELWIVDLGAQRVEAHGDPAPDGYRTVRYFPRGERISPAFAPDLVIEVDAILGQPRTEVAPA